MIRKNKLIVFFVEYYNLEMKYRNLIVIAALMATSVEAHKLVQKTAIRDEVDDLLEK